MRVLYIIRGNITINAQPFKYQRILAEMFCKLR